MSKFIVQLLLSVTLSVGAVVGFRPDVRGELNKTVREARQIVGGTVEAVFETAEDLKVRTAVAISAKFNARNSAKGDLKTDVKTNGDAEVELFGANNLFEAFIPELSTKGELTTDTRTNTEVELGEAELELKNKLKSDLELSVDD